MRKGLSSTNGARETVYPHKRMKINPYLTPCTTVNSKENKNLNIKPETIKLPEEIIAGKLHDIGMGNNLLDMTPKTQITKQNIDKRDYIKLKNCTAKETINRVQRQPARCLQTIYWKRVNIQNI